MLVSNMCPISQEPIEKEIPGTADVVEIICPTCGRFRITGSAIIGLKVHRLEVRAEILERAKEAAREGEIPQINSGHL